MAVSTGTAILGGAAIGGLGSILGGREARKGAQAGANTQWQMYQDQMERNAPFREIGLNALRDYEKSLKTPLAFDPSYGIKQLDSSAAARGSFGSTGHLSRIADYATRGQYDAQSAHLNRLAALAGLGQTATNSMNATSQATGNNLSNLAQSAGNARASTYMGLANTANNALSQYMYGRGMGMFQPTNPMAGYQPGMGYSPQQFVTGNY